MGYGTSMCGSGLHLAGVPPRVDESVSLILGWQEKDLLSTGVWVESCSIPRSSLLLCLHYFDPASQRLSRYIPVPRTIQNVAQGKEHEVGKTCLFTSCVMWRKLLDYSEPWFTHL